MKNRKTISRGAVALTILGVIFLVISLIKFIFPNNSAVPKGEEKPTVITKTKEEEPTNINVPERKFTFHNADGSIHEVVYLKYLVGRTPFTEGCYQIHLTDDEILLLCRYVFAESGTTESLVGQVAVAAEVINRLEDENFPDTLEEVLSEENQYYEDGIPYWYDVDGIWRPVYDSDFTEKVRAAVELALQGADPTEQYFEGNGALFHYSPKFSAGDGKAWIKDQVPIGNHNFYREWDVFQQPA